MDRPQQEIRLVASEVGKRQDLNSNVLSILHHNVQSLKYVTGTNRFIEYRFCRFRRPMFFRTLAK
jgi:hypothetical protein